MFFLLSAVFFSKGFFSKKNFRHTIRVSNNLDPNSLQRLSADDTSRQRANLMDKENNHKFMLKNNMFAKVALTCGQIFCPSVV